MFPLKKISISILFFRYDGKTDGKRENGPKSRYVCPISKKLIFYEKTWQITVRVPNPKQN